MNTTKQVVEIRPGGKKKIQARMGFEPMTYAIPVQCALPIELTSQLGAGHCVGSK